MGYVIFLCMALLIFAANASAADLDVINQNPPPAYDYPIHNAYAATVIGVPPEMKVDFSKAPKPDEKKLEVYPDREVPEGFWYERGGMRYAELLQDKPAPLVFVIAGTGADARGEKMAYMAAILYHAGFHVVLLPSPTHPNFIINASSNFITGNPRHDAVDLYKVMQIINAQVVKKAQVNGYMVTGYSLGAMNAAFVAKLDDEQHILNFSRVLLINPPYNLYSSLSIIDTMLYSALPHGIDDVDKFIKTLMIRFSSVNQSGDPLDFSNERMLIDAYNKYKPSDARLATTIGLSFRLWASSMVFTSDVMSKSGYIFPKNQEFATSTHLTEYMAVAFRTGLKNYFNDVYTKYYMAESPGTTRDDLVEQSSLDSLASYIHGNNKIGLITNADDVILAPGEIDKLKTIFWNNAVIFDSGGHVGNLMHPTVAYYIVKFLREGGQ